MSKILVIEDERDLQTVLAYNLKQEGYLVFQALQGRAGLDIAIKENPDLILLDLMLPDMPGTEICKTLRADPRTKSTRIIMLTAKGEDIDRVLGFELGADDYIVKPFLMRELLLRIKAILRRAKEEPATKTDSFEFGRLRVDKEAHKVWIDGGEIELTALEFKLLVTLHDRRNRVQTRSVLLDDVWGIEADITTRTVDTHVKRLREKLGPAGEYIETVRSVGYRFTDRPPDQSMKG